MPHLNPSQAGYYLIYLSHRNERLSWPGCNWCQDNHEQPNHNYLTAVHFPHGRRCLLQSLLPCGLICSYASTGWTFEPSLVTNWLSNANDSFITEAACHSITVTTYIGTVSADRDTEAKKLEEILWLVKLDTLSEQFPQQALAAYLNSDQSGMSALKTRHELQSNGHPHQLTREPLMITTHWWMLKLLTVFSEFSTGDKYNSRDRESFSSLNSCKSR